MENQCKEKDLLVAYSEGEVDENTYLRLDAHIQGCEVCSQTLMEIKGTLGLIRETLHQQVHAMPSQKDWDRFDVVLKERLEEVNLYNQTFTRLSQEKQRIGLVPLPLSHYVRELAKSAGVSLKPVLKSLGVMELPQAHFELIPIFAQFVQKLGFNLDEALLILRLDFAHQQATAPVQSFHFRSTSEKDDMAFYKRVLQDVESEYDVESLKSLEAMKNAITMSYKKLEEGIF